MRRVIDSAAFRWTWLLVALSAAAVYPALRYNIGALAYDAGTVHIYRSYVFSGALAEGWIYPRWVQFLHLGLGSPLFTFNPPLPYYALDLLYRLGLPHPVGWRILTGAGLLFAATGAYLLVHLLTARRWPAILAAVAFLYAPYVLRNALERGSLEVFSMFLYPWVLWATLWVARRPAAGRFIAAALLWAACIASHVLGPLMLAPFAAFVAILAAWRYRTLAPLLALLAGGLLTAAIWLPIFPEQQYVQLELDWQNPLSTPAKHPIPLDRLLALPVVYDLRRGNNGSGDNIGILQTCLLLLGIPAAIVAWARRRRRLALLLAGTTCAGLLLFWMLTDASDPVWIALAPVLTRLEFRTRWMGLEALAAAVVAGLALSLLPARWQRYVAIGAIALITLAALPSLYVNLQHRYGPFGNSLSPAEVRAAEISSGGSAFTSWNEFAPLWRTDPFGAQFLADLGGSGFDARSSPLAEVPPGVQVTAPRITSQAWDLTVETAQPVTLTLHLLYYPRWQAQVDGKAAELAPERGSGFVRVAVPAGMHELALRYGTPPVEKAGLAISGLTFIGLIVLGLVGLEKRRRSQPKSSAGGEQSAAVQEHAPPLWLLSGLTVLLIFKFAYVDTVTTWFRCVSMPARVCDAQATVDVPFNGGPRLRGYSVLDNPLRAGQELRVDLFWQGDPSALPQLNSFVHVRNAQKGWPMNPRTGQEIWAQEEHQTPGGLLVSEFSPDQLYRDEFRLRLPDDLPPGQYFLEIGWFDPATGEQLEPQTEAVRAPLSILWRSILLPSIQVRLGRRGV